MKITQLYRSIRYGNLVSDAEVMRLMPAFPFKQDGTKLTKKEITSLFRTLKDSLIKERLRTAPYSNNSSL